MFHPDKTQIADLDQVWEIPNIIPPGRRTAFCERMNLVRDELQRVFEFKGIRNPTRALSEPDQLIGTLTAQITDWAWDAISTLQDWFVEFLRNDDPPVDAHVIENTVRQFEIIGAFLAFEAWNLLALLAERLATDEEEVTVYGRRILSAINQSLILTVQAIRDWGEQKRLESANTSPAGRRKKSTTRGRGVPGRPPTIDPAEDEKLYNDYKSSGLSHKEFTKSRDLKPTAVYKARDRMQKRSKRPPE